jgi:hypothetical protein
LWPAVQTSCMSRSKLCSFDNLDYINRAGGRFVTVRPRCRQEDGHFRKWVQTQTPEWDLVWDRPHPRYQDGPRDRWSVYRDPLGSREGWSRGWSLVWVWSTLLTLHQQGRRHRNLVAATEALTALRQRVMSARARLRGASRIDLAVEEILERYHMRPYLKGKPRVASRCARSTPSSKPDAGGQERIPRIGASLVAATI